MGGKVSMTLSPLLIRADASAQIGTGHVMRCLALAQAWQAQGGAVTFATMKTLPDALQTRLQNEHIALHLLDTEPGSEDDARQTAALAASLGAAAVVVDGYHFGGDYQRILKEAGLKLLFIDDNAHADHYYADFVLNQNSYASEGMYPNREPYTILLLSTLYTMLRREFWSWRGWEREIPDVARKLLVTLGGSDPENVTAKILDALELVDIDGLEIAIVAGGSNPHLSDLQRRVRESRHKIDLKQNVEDMPALMAWADAAVSAAGTTIWELAFMGVPTALMAVAENQWGILEDMVEADACTGLGWHEDKSPEAIATAIQTLLIDKTKRERFAWVGHRVFVDGFGVERVVSYLKYPFLRFRLAHIDDCRMVWEWANEPVTRAMSFSSEPIAWETHVQWFEHRLKDVSCWFLIAEDQAGTPIGQVRYEREKPYEVTISVSIAPEFRRRGYGEAMIVLSIDELSLRLTDVIHAYIKPDNLASIRAFEKAGFVDQGMTTVKDSPAKHFVYSRLPAGQGR
jgi:UDP-2,4-diacetamido-2,4,6-trideoxy-beta-L-altropyranose hydrolase